MSETAVSTAVPESSPGSSPAKKVLAGLLLPLFFVVALPLAFVSALHDPTPNDLPLLVVGPEAVVADIAAGLDATEEFAATRTDVVSEARGSVEDRTVEGSIEVTVTPAPADASAPTTYAVTTYVAAATGGSVSSAVQSVGADVADSLGTTSQVVDVAPLDTQDPLGTTLFYLLTYTSLGAYLVIIVLTQVKPDATLRLRYLAVGIASVVAPLLVFGLSSIFIGDYDRSFAGIVALLGVNALYVFTVGAAAILVQQLLGKAVTFGVMSLVVFLNFPSAGGAGSASTLPDFWQGVHSVYFGAGAMESFRSIVYFDGNGTGRWFFQLLAWTVGLVLLTFVVHLMKTVRAQRTRLAELEGGATAALGPASADVEHTRPTAERAPLSSPPASHDDHHRPDQSRPAPTPSQGALR